MGQMLLNYLGEDIGSTPSSFSCLLFSSFLLLSSSVSALTFISRLIYSLCILLLKKGLMIVFFLSCLVLNSAKQSPRPLLLKSINWPFLFLNARLFFSSIHLFLSVKPFHLF